jgi:hypothetical protein
MSPHYWRIKVQFSLAWLMLFLTSFFVTSYGATAQTIPPSAHEASRAWAAIEAHGTGLYEGGGFVFAVAEFPWIGRSRGLDARATVLTNQQLARRFIVSHLPGSHQKTLAEAVLNQPTLTRAILQQVRISGQVLESGPKPGAADIYRRVVAIPLDRVTFAGLDADKIDQMYANLLSQVVENWLVHPFLFQQLGMHSLALIATRHNLSRSVNTTNLLAPTGDPIELRIQYQAYINEGRWDPDTLTQWPGEFSVISLQLQRVSDDPLQELAWRSVSCLDTRAAFPQKYQNIDLSINTSALVLIDAGYVLQRAIHCLGFVTLEYKFSSQRPAFFGEMEQVFREGRDLQTALDLAMRAVEVAPLYEESWGYLSAAWRASGESELAKLAARVRLSIAPTSEDALRFYLSLLEADGSNDISKIAADLKRAIGT